MGRPGAGFPFCSSNITDFAISHPESNPSQSRIFFASSRVPQGLLAGFLWREVLERVTGEHPQPIFQLAVGPSREALLVLKPPVR